MREQRSAGSPQKVEEQVVEIRKSILELTLHYAEVRYNPFLTDGFARLCNLVCESQPASPYLIEPNISCTSALDITCYDYFDVEPSIGIIMASR